MEEIAREGLRLPPHSVDAEKSVLGAMLIEHSALEQALELLRAEDFYVPAHETLFAAMRDIRYNGGAVDAVTLASLLDTRGLLQRAGGQSYILELMDFVPTAANVAYYISIVEEKSVLRQLVSAGTEITRLAMEETSDLESILSEAEKRIYQISMRKSSDKLVSMGELVPIAFNRIGELINRKGKLTGISTGFIDFDRMTSGLQKSDLIIVAGRPAMGKSSFAMNIAQYACLHDNRTAIVFSLEMSAEQLVMRMLCTEATVESQRIKEGLVDDRDLENLMEVVAPMSSAKMYIDDTGGITVPEIRSKCRRLQARSGLDLIVIDYMQLITGSGIRKSENRQQEVSDITRQLKLLARELDVPIILLSQLNRGPDQRSDHTPMISDLRESGSIEQDADMVVLLYRPAAYDPSLDNTSDIIIAKHRHGPTGTVQLVWKGEYTCFMNKAPQEG